VLNWVMGWACSLAGREGQPHWAAAGGQGRGSRALGIGRCALAVLLVLVLGYGGARFSAGTVGLGESDWRYYLYYLGAYYCGGFLAGLLARRSWHLAGLALWSLPSMVPVAVGSDWWIALLLLVAAPAVLIAGAYRGGHDREARPPSDAGTSHAGPATGSAPST